MPYRTSLVYIGTYLGGPWRSRVRNSYVVLKLNKRTCTDNPSRTGHNQLAQKSQDSGQVLAAPVNTTVWSSRQTDRTFVRCVDGLVGIRETHSIR